jgi:hypothetical protein
VFCKRHFKNARARVECLEKVATGLGKKMKKRKFLNATEPRPRLYLESVGVVLGGDEGDGEDEGEVTVEGGEEDGDVDEGTEEEPLVQSDWSVPFQKHYYLEHNQLAELLARAYRDVGSKYSEGGPRCSDLYELVIKTFNPDNRPTHEAERVLATEHVRVFKEQHNLSEDSVLPASMLSEDSVLPASMLSEDSVLPASMLTEQPLTFFQSIGRVLHQTRQRLGVTHVEGVRQFPPGHDGAGAHEKLLESLSDEPPQPEVQTQAEAQAENTEQEDAEVEEMNQGTSGGYEEDAEVGEVEEIEAELLIFEDETNAEAAQSFCTDLLLGDADGDADGEVDGEVAGEVAGGDGARKWEHRECVVQVLRQLAEAGAR